MGVAEEFRTFRERYNIGADLISSIGSHYRRITARLNKDFWGSDSDQAHSRYVGSYGRDTAAKGISDVDMAFILPYATYAQYHRHLYNGQSALLQALRRSLNNTFPVTKLGGDGQVVILPFSDKIKFEVLPVFDNKDGSWTYANSNNGGSWQVTNPKAEIAAIDSRNREVNGNLKALCRMMRVWRDYCNVPIRGHLIDTLAYRFIITWEFGDRSYAYHDFMVRDFFWFMANQNKNQQYWIAPGSKAHVPRTGTFEFKAKIAYNIANLACGIDDQKFRVRRQKWRQIFGSTFPA